MRGSWRRNITEIFWLQSYGRQRCVFLVLQGCSTRGPGPTLLGHGFLYCILSASSLDPNSSEPKWPLRPDVAFLTTSSLQLVCNSTGRNSTATPTVLQLNCNTGIPTGTWLPFWLRYIIIQRPHDRPLDLWNRMFHRHQAEITVMHFTGHSLPVHQSMSVPWEFF